MSEQGVESGNNSTGTRAPARRMNLAITKVGLAPQNLMEAMEMAKMLAYSGMVPKQYDANQVEPKMAIGGILAALQYGYELGLSPMSALQNIATINGRPSIWGDGFWALILAHPDCEDAIESFDDNAMTATCTIKRRGRQPITRTFSKTDADTAGLWGKQGPWKQYPKRMMQMRARGFAGRDAFPDALRGVHLAEESLDVPRTVSAAPEWVDESGGPVEGIHSVRAKPKAEATQPEPAAEPPHNPQTGEVDHSYGPPPMTDEERHTRLFADASAPAKKGLGW